VLLVLLAFVWGSQTTGMVSSNDGSHVALARALALRGETRIDPEMALTLRVDVAQRDGHVYSDRPPGTAFAALPAVWVGARLDDPLFEASRERGRMLVAPAAEPFIYTYAARFEGATALARYMGTALVLAFHTVGMGLLALLGLERLLRRRGVDPGGRVFVLVAVGLGTLWGPYATTLFSHGTTVTALTWFLLALDHLHEEDAARTWAALAGLAGAWAIAADYITLLAVVPATMLVARPRTWPAVLLGTLPLVVATLAYHQAAFGHPLAIGYQFHGNFEFARDTATTFDGNPLVGAWTLLGFGHEGAGLLARSPIALVGIVGWVVARGRDRRYLIAWLPWLVLLCMHHTPWGGATIDHRYLLPLLPLVGLGIGLAWQRWLAGNPALIVGACGLWLISAGLTWSKFLAWHDTPAFPSPWVGVGVAVVVAAAWWIGTPLRARVSRKSP
jgi:hypothetical protein